jgi:hypothetical protein
MVGAWRAGADRPTTPGAVVELIAATAAINRNKPKPSGPWKWRPWTRIIRNSPL